MKTAISVDDELVREADGAAHEMGVSRSRLFSLAMESFLRSRRQAAATEQLNRVYAAPPTPAEKALTARMKAKFRTTIKERW